MAKAMVSFSSEEIYEWEWDDINRRMQSTNFNKHSTTSQTTISIKTNYITNLSFDYAVSSESNYDKFIIMLDGSTIINSVSGNKSGVYNAELTQGKHTLVLKYAKDNSESSNDDRSYVSNIKLDLVSIHLEDGTFYENAEEIAGTNISYTRTFNNTNWQAIYVPFCMNYADWKDNFDVARINDVHQWDDDDDGTIDRTELEVIKIKGGSTEPNTPYLVRSKSVGEKAITLNNATLCKTEENTFDVTSWNTKFNFTGTYKGISGTEMMANGYYAVGDGKLVQAASTSSNLKPFRWYLTVTDRNGNRKDINEVKIHVFDDEDDCQQTSVNDVFDHTGDADMFDLNGRKVEQMRKGIYVKNGKKIVVR